MCPTSISQPQAAEHPAREEHQQAFRLLQDTSRSLYGSASDFCSRTVPVFKQLEALLDIGPLRFYIRDPDRDEDVQVATTFARERPGYCRDAECVACLDTDRDDRNGVPVLTLPVRTDHEALGSLEVFHPRHAELGPDDRSLLRLLADQLATAVYLQRRMDEQQQQSLLEERAVIGRELHDSLAQSLTYLKVQVARLERLQQESGAPDAQGQVCTELRAGLSAAHRQLRELMTTFRLKLDVPGLSAALRQTVSELQVMTDATVEIDCELPPQMLTPNEEIHVLQIVREALANAIRHARASRIAVVVGYRTPQVHVNVRDDGVGLPGGDLPEHHYGIVIMRERATSLRGRVSVHNRPEGGVEVALAFPPKNSGASPG
jgi:two-component system, NarL family, nitrate/nitrite sensor histidine kinase NarX